MPFAKWSVYLAIRDFTFQILLLGQEQFIKRSIILPYFRVSGKRNFYVRDPWSSIFSVREPCQRLPCTTLKVIFHKILNHSSLGSAVCPLIDFALLFETYQSKISQMMVRQRNPKNSHTLGFFGFFDAPSSERSWLNLCSKEKENKFCNLSDLRIQSWIF